MSSGILLKRSLENIEDLIDKLNSPNCHKNKGNYNGDFLTETSITIITLEVDIIIQKILSN